MAQSSVLCFVSISIARETGARVDCCLHDNLFLVLLQTLFLPGFPKSATTWLYNCFLDAFAPRRAGCGADASGWGVHRCNRTFLLPPLTAASHTRREVELEAWLVTRVTCVPLCEQAAAIVRRELQLSPLKETFYFGGSRQRRCSAPHASESGALALHACLRSTPSTRPAASHPTTCHQPAGSPGGWIRR